MTGLTLIKVIVSGYTHLFLLVLLLFVVVGGFKFVNMSWNVHVVYLLCFDGQESTWCDELCSLI